MHFDIQASPKCVELFGWEQLSEIADSYIKKHPDTVFYPEKWFHGTQEEKAEAPDRIKMAFLLVGGMTIEVLTYIDKDGISVVSFDPQRRITEPRIGIVEGHHRYAKEDRRN